MTGRYPRRFGKYVLLKPLAKGGMGEIYIAAGGDVGGFEKLCVIKKVITEKADRGKAARFMDEAKVVLRLAHSALVTTFDAGDVDGEFYIAMELVEGKDLREVWNRCVRTRQRIPLDVALHVVREVARSLAYVHSYGDLKLVHRDVAPPNILLAYVGDVKLTDFGLARSILKQEHTAPGVVFGRAAYLAPEQARGEVADARTDVYTLGIVLWELLTGQQYLQLAGLDAAAALAIVRHPKVVAPSTRAPWISPALDRVVMRALAPDRPHRFQTADEMRQSLADVIADIAPRAEAARVAEFLRTIYSDTIEEERVERERFLKEIIPKSRAAGLALEPAPPERSRPAAPIAAVDVPAPASPGAPAPPPPPVSLSPAARPPGSPARVTRPLQPLRLPGLAPGPTGPRARDVPGTQAPAPAIAARQPPQGPPAAAPSAETGRPTKESPPRAVGPYRLIRALVEGRIGSLHVGSRGQGQEAAVRLLRLTAPGDDALVDRVRAQVKKVSSAGHPGLPAVSEVSLAEDGRLCLTMEPVAGTDLATLLGRERRLDAGRAVQIAVQICSALGAGHALGVLHEELVPERVLVQPRGPAGDAVRVLDLGACGRSTGREPTRTVDAAAAAYLAPEQLRGGPADPRSDVYAVGAILYEMLTGAAPYAGASDPVARKLFEPPQAARMFRPELPAELERIVMTALDADPTRRPATVAALEELLTGHAGGARDPGPAAPRSGLRGAGPGHERRRARRDAAFRAISELESMGSVATPMPLLAEPVAPAPPPIPASPTPAPSVADEPAAARVGAAHTNGWSPGAVSPPAAAAQAFGGAVLARYGAADPSARRGRTVRNAIIVALALGGAVLLARSLSSPTTPPAKPGAPSSK